MDVFTASQFTPTGFSTATEKAQFANRLLAFLWNGCPRHLFTRALYKRLNSCFGHIAHYNIHGFYEEWFSDQEKIERFLANLLEWRCYGSPAFTFSDVEEALQAEVRRRGLYEQYRRLNQNAGRESEAATPA